MKQPDSILYTAKQIQRRVTELAKDISNYYKGQKLIAVAIREGGLRFATDLLDQVKGVDIYRHSIGIKSFVGNDERGDSIRVEETSDCPIVNTDNYLLIDDLYESGHTLFTAESHFQKVLNNTVGGKANVRRAVLINKIGFDERGLSLDFVGFDFRGGDWIYGYGMDDNEAKRDLPDIYSQNNC